jgi:hypothetical protein
LRKKLITRVSNSLQAKNQNPNPMCNGYSILPVVQSSHIKQLQEKKINFWSDS